MKKPILIAGLLLVGGYFSYTPDASSANHHNKIEITEVSIKMSDGIRLAADIYWPAGADKKDRFPILLEYLPYRKDEYKATFKIFYSDIKVRELLKQKNISFSQPKNISAIFFPVHFVNEEIQDFYENFFYKQWTTIKIKNELINFILPLEDLDDISKIKEMKNRIEELNVDDFVNKYDIKSYVFTLMNHQNSQLNVYIKTNFNDSSTSKNITYELSDIGD